MIAQTTTCGYTESLSQSQAVIPPRQSAAFFMPACRQSYPSLVGVETRHTTPARGNRDAASCEPRVRPTARTKAASLNHKEATMPNALFQFNFQTNAVRTIAENGEIWFVAKDISKALDYSQSSTAAVIFQSVPDEWKGIKPIDTLGGRQKLLMISEQGLYFFLGRSDKPKALPFQKWLAGEVLPSIRKTGSYSVSISKAQQGELATLIAERFPSGKDRPYAWSRFNNHFRLASYKDLPSSRFEEACEYIKTMPEPVPALPKQEAHSHINLFDPDEFMRVRAIANKYIEDVAEKARGGNVTPSMEIPDEVLAGIVAMQMWKNNFTIGFSHEGKVAIWKTPDPFDTVARIISDPGWGNLVKISHHYSQLVFRHKTQHFK